VNSRSMGAKSRPREVDVGVLREIVERTAAGSLAHEDRELLGAAIDTLATVTSELEQKGVSIRRLRKLLFGATTETTSQVLGDGPGGGDRQQGAGDTGDADKSNGEKKKRKGHGRNPASAYTGARQVEVPHRSLGRGDRCPKCERGNLHELPEPKRLVRVTGMAPLCATVYNLQRFRCATCGETSSAKAPPGVGEKKYDETVAAMVGLLKYGAGMPFYRLEKLQRSFGIPLPASTQWDLVREASTKLESVHDEMIRRAAHGELLHNDDTVMKVLELMAERAPDPVSDRQRGKRKGVYTTGVVSKVGEHRIGLFFTGHNHAGENLERVLAERAAELGPPIQMSDALSHNTAGDFETIEANCIAHARRHFVEVAPNFPEQCRHVLETLREVYRVEARAREAKLSDEDRLLLHRKENALRMGYLKRWMYRQLHDKKTEPSSGLGQAITYMLKHWKKLVCFLRVPGAPLDNNIVERALKRAILHRKNALFYKTQNGALVGDRFMSLIHTAELAGANPWDYLVQLQRHAAPVEERPADWMPWNYRDALADLRSRDGAFSPGPDDL